ncbi:hypothetical protein [Massilia sp. YMA4]|uniref:Uncharacterized protein n=1 Tax=[Empedobacter] haloabium TaxID=592317 RepID=A0ABZ1URR2_9BURK|nr:hypothetical protein [Massilia sp. YMA4]AXA91332.1 hypothetical protein DPH57_09310 [Massilia sp. YMA4]
MLDLLELGLSRLQLVLTRPGLLLALLFHCSAEVFQHLARVQMLVFLRRLMSLGDADAFDQVPAALFARLARQNFISSQECARQTKAGISRFEMSALITRHTGVPQWVPGA